MHGTDRTPPAGTGRPARGPILRECRLWWGAPGGAGGGGAGGPLPCFRALLRGPLCVPAGLADPAVHLVVDEDALDDVLALNEQDPLARPGDLGERRGVVDDEVRGDQSAPTVAM